MTFEDEDLKNLQILTDQELEIIDIIREKGTKKIEIYFGKDEKPELLKITNAEQETAAARSLPSSCTKNLKINLLNCKLIIRIMKQ